MARRVAPAHNYDLLALALLGLGLRGGIVDTYLLESLQLLLNAATAWWDNAYENST